MSLVSLQADINERRLENGATTAQFDPKLTAALKFLDMTPEELIELRKWVRPAFKESTEGLLREMTLVYTLNEPKDCVTGVEHLENAGG